MGFGLQYVLSDESHYREFVCKICLDLVDLPGSYTTKCAHVFCSSCVNEWIKSCGAVGNEEYDVMNPAPTTFPPVPCPACKEPLVINRDIVPFNSLRGERLAFRLLNSIRCRCPLGGGSGRCTWEGDYSEVQAHLTNTESHREEFGTPSPPILRDRNDNFRWNKLYDHDDVGLHFHGGSNAAADELEARLLTNRGACWMACGVFKHAVQDCQLATKKDPLFAKGFIRLSSAMFLSGASVQEAIGVLSAAAEATSSSKAPATGAASARTAQQVSSFQSEIRAKSTEFSLLAAALIDGQQALVETSKYIARRFSVTVLAEQKFQTAHDLAAAQFGSSQVPPDLLLWLARSKLANAKSDQANVLTRRVLRSNRQNVDALTVQALVLFVDGEVEQAATIVKEALKLNPDSAEALFLLKKVVKPLSAALVGGRAAVAAREFGQALEKFEAGIELVKDEDLVASRGTPSKESASAGRGEHEVSFGGELLREPPSSPPTAPTAASAPLNLDAIAKENAAISALPKSLVFTQLLTEAATASFRLKDFKRCLKLCEHAIYARGDYRDALVLRANTLVNLGRYEEAVRSLEGDVRSMFEQDTLVQHAHQKAVFELRRSQRPDYYDLLSRPYQRADRASTTTSTGSTSGASSASDIEKEMKRVKLDNNSSSSTTTYYKLSSFSTQTDIKNFYKQRCLELHPDKHAGESEEEQRKAKERFQLVQEAFEILCDDAKRKLWDEGYDKAAIEERIRAMHDAAHRNSGWGKHHHHHHH
eukprot:g13151.t1